MEEYPSGQRGQTVNLLASPSVVRIHPPPPRTVVPQGTAVFSWWRRVTDTAAAPAAVRSNPRSVKKICRRHIFSVGPVGFADRVAPSGRAAQPPAARHGGFFVVEEGDRHCRRASGGAFESPLVLAKSVLLISAAAKSAPLPCSSSPHRTRFAGLRRGPRVGPVGFADRMAPSGRAAQPPAARRGGFL